VTVRKGPIGCFLFLGPTGVGKTETSKALAEIYFGSEERMIRLDMSEFQNISDIPRLISSPGEEGLLTTKVRENPFSLILLDEIEKAHSNILNLFLQVFDEGFLTDGLGRKVDFKNSIIIATSNAGYQIILEALKQKTEWSQVKEKLLDYLFEKGIFRPEFINRFDAVVVFKPLTKENLLAISELLLQKIKKNLAQKEIEFIITEPLKEKIVELSYEPKFGARNMQRVIQDKIGNPLASAILSGQLRKGERVTIDPEEFRLIINP
jgi:ATP-dependent Clp protease ATP-binding subunit ClpC